MDRWCGELDFFRKKVRKKDAERRELPKCEKKNCGQELNRHRYILIDSPQPPLTATDDKNLQSKKTGPQGLH